MSNAQDEPMLKKGDPIPLVKIQIELGETGPVIQGFQAYAMDSPLLLPETRKMVLAAFDAAVKAIVAVLEAHDCSVDHNNVIVDDANILGDVEDPDFFDRVKVIDSE